MNTTLPGLAEKLVQISLKLKPSQAFADDPSDNTFTLSTECIVPSQADDELARIIKSRQADELMVVQRYNHEFKITFVRSVVLSDWVVE